MDAVTQELAAWWNEMPPAWTEVEKDLTLDSVKELLLRYKSANFWEAQ